MAERTRTPRTSRAKSELAEAPKDTKAALEEAAQAPENANAPFTAPAVLVWQDVQPNGDRQIQVSLLNGLDPFAAPSLLEYAVSKQREVLGI